VGDYDPAAMTDGPPAPPSPRELPEGSGARLVRNTLANAVGSVIGVLVALALTPFMIHELGVAAFGVWTLAFTLTFVGGYAALTDLGVEAATIRFVAEARSADDSTAVNRTASTSLAFFLGIALCLTPPFVAVAGLLAHVFNIDPALRDDAQLCFALVACQLLFELPARVFLAVMRGAQRFAAFQAIEVGRALLQGGLFVLVLVLGWGIVGLGGVVLASSLGVLLVSYAQAQRIVPSLRVRPSLVTRRELRRLVGYGGGVLVLRVVGTLYRQMDKAIIGVALGPSFVTTYEVANKVQSGVLMVQSLSSSAVQPAAAHARRQAAILRDMYLRGTCWTMAATLPCVVAAFAFAEPLIRTWVGADLTEAAGPTQLFVLYLLLVAVHGVGYTIVVALGRLRYVMVVSVANVAINLTLSILLVGPLDIEGVILGTLIAQALAWPVLLRYFLRSFDVGIGEFSRVVLWPNFPGLALQCAVAVPLLLLARETDNLAAVGGLALVSVACSVGVFVGVGLAREQRRVLLTTLRRAVGLRPAT
jgi:O-antigen/teichoic acid export membrane protein